MAEDLHRYLQAEPISARPPTRWYLIRKFAKRNRTAVAAATAVLITLLAGIGLTAWQAVRATSAEQTVARQLEQLKSSYELETRNQELTQKIEQKAEVEKAMMSADIESLIQLGQWAGGLEKMDEYELQFGELPINLQILRLNAFDGLSQRELLKQQIVDLENHSDAGSVESELQLWRGYGFLYDSEQTVDSRSLIRAAIAGFLPEDDRLFAQGLIADSLPMAAEQYRLALRNSPFHSQARLQLVVTLLFLGRYEEVLDEIEIGMTLFANDERFYLAETIAHALAGNSILARRSLDETQQLFPGVNMDMQRSLVLLSRSVNQQFREYDRQGLFNWMSVLPDALGLFEGESYKSAPLPEFQKVQVANAYSRFVRALVNPLLTVAIKQKKHRFLISECQAAWDLHPDNVFKCFEGWSWLNLRDWERAAQAFRLASEGDGLFPDIRNQACYGLFLSHNRLFEKYQREQDAQLAIEALQTYLAGPEFELHRADTMLAACCDNGNWGLARQVCQRAVERGQPARHLKSRLINYGLAAGKTGLALEVCQELLAETPNDPVMRKRQAAILRRIRQESKITRYGV